ncbi:ShET2 enterotoxin domain-containing protein [Yersinia pseudotuberculosis]|uniref:ShET2/EspL2 family type III secretion system effector toxin n=1 Tax=Yersinia pseudotuberculosis TaxID=633 RepID=UPI0004F8A981|nr:ShET2/EspL2 family type III secretion system effector toxin [Yersinia pseudotuberculosis]AIN16488.1 hypothetical protein DJ40_3117 [Yersinia pseudotuberculosis]AJJ08034.1 hypothetical protein BZ20_2810 [Yersinia pseudotuberculosis]MBO1556242.1 ShET2/EspL2 family type III secretion system effector toxin [Yersinia pseudotuberculosis]MBO1562487.1 ShET2/EspL2 family type III secretion system effector toxin [Yersinia pseudotuberculosis]CNK62414.1 ShET2 enterotoxin domain-containing protein [Yers
MDIFSSFNLYNKEVYSNSPTHPTFDKSKPYISELKSREEKNLNGEVNFKDNVDKLIMCRHLSSQYILDSLSDEDTGKVDLDKFSSKDIIANRITSNVEELYEQLQLQAKEIYFIPNNEFGICLSKIFKSMERKSENTQSILLESFNHAMAVRLRIKENENNNTKRYVISVYDPNMTNVTVRCEVDDLVKVRDFQVKDFINHHLFGNFYKSYYPTESSEISTLYICKKPANESVPECTGKKITFYDWIALPASSINLYTFLIEGFSQEIKNLKNQLEIINKKNPEKLMEILTAKSPDGTMGFEQALNNDHADAINAFGELLQLVPENKRSELLANDKQIKYTLLDIACSRENKKTIMAFKNIVSLLPENERYKLMESKINTLDVIISLFITKQDSDNLNEICEFISLAPEKHFINLLSNIDITQYLEYPLYHNDAKSINIITKMLNKLSEQGRENIPWIRKLDESIVDIYIQLGKKEAVAAYRELLVLKPGTLKESK